MTLPDNETKTLLKTVRALLKETQRAGMSLERFAADAGVSTSTIFAIKRYKRDYRPGKYVEERLRAYVKKLKQKYPESVEK